MARLGGRRPGPPARRGYRDRDVRPTPQRGHQDLVEAWRRAASRKLVPSNEPGAGHRRRSGSPRSAAVQVRIRPRAHAENRGESRAPRRRAVPARRLDRDGSPIGRRAVPTRGYGRSNGSRKASIGGDDTVVLSTERRAERGSQLSVLAQPRRGRRTARAHRRWSLTSLQHRLRTAAPVSETRGYYWLFPRVTCTRPFQTAMLQRIWALPPAG